MAETKRPRQTLAIVVKAPKEAPELEEIVLDEPRTDEAIVEIHAVGICHADVAVLQGTIPLPFPRVLGHEGRRTGLPAVTPKC
jgi:aryl-alcohol dehydrogenase